MSLLADLKSCIIANMFLRVANTVILGLVASLQAVQATALSSNGFKIKPFTIDLSQNVEHMFDLITSTYLPDKEEYPGVSSDLGIPLRTLKKLRKDWVSDFDWDKEQASMNKYAPLSCKAQV